MKNLIKTVCILLGLTMTAPVWAIPMSTVGSIDTYMSSISLANSGDATEEAWVQGEVGSTSTIDYQDRTEEAGFGFMSVDGLTNTFAHSLIGTPDYFLIKIGTGKKSGVDSHYLFKNEISLDYAVFTFAQLGITDLDPLSHISEFAYITTSTVSEPGTFALLAGGLIIALFARRRQQQIA